MGERTTISRRDVHRVHTKMRLGSDQQVLDKAMVIAPTDLMLTDPFLLLSEDWFDHPGFDWHPHRGLETVTLVVDGVLEHGDSLGHAGLLEAGDVQWMTAGRGIIHREVAFRNEHAHTLQLWVNLPASHKLVETRYQDLRASSHAVISRQGVNCQVISGSTGQVTGPAANHWPILGMLLTLDPGTSYTQLLPTHDRVFVYVMSGRLTIAGAPVEAGQVAWSDPIADDGASSLDLHAAEGEQTKMMLYAGRPIGEPVVFGGPFVMNTQTQIEQAFRDFHAGKFGEIPRQARRLTR